MRLASNADHFMAVVGALRAAGLTVGEGVREDNAGNVLAPPCVVVRSTAGQGKRGPVGAPHDDATPEFEVMCVATTARGAEVLRDQVQAALLSGIAVTGRAVRVSHVLPVGVNRDPDVPELYTGFDRFAAWSTPA